MKFVSFDNFQIGVVQDDKIYDISKLGDPRWRNTRYAMTEFIREYDRLKESAKTEVLSVAPKTLSSIRLLPPVPSPTHLFAAPLNYQKHVKEMTGSNIVSAGFIPQSAAELGFFLKATGSLVGASGFINALIDPLEILANLRQGFILFGLTHKEGGRPVYNPLAKTNCQDARSSQLKNIFIAI